MPNSIYIASILWNQGSLYLPETKYPLDDSQQGTPENVDTQDLDESSGTVDE